MDLLVTCARHFEEETKNELKSILQGLGDPDPHITITEYSGILTVDTVISPLDVIKKIRDKLEDEPWSIRYTLRVIPVFATVATDAKSIASAALGQTQKMGPDETYRITIEKRNSEISSSEIISQIADNVKNKVSLKEHDWVILVEVLGAATGVSVLRGNDILSVQKTKRHSAD
ncbi:MAG: THUMP domain-containing protein [Candidatus Nitrosotenuis sp.]